MSPAPVLPNALLTSASTLTASETFTFDLAQARPNKTVDIGRNGVSLSLDAQGRVLQASIYHPEHGIVVAIPFEQFDGTQFHNQVYVREYRTRMLRFLAEDRPGFGLDFDLKKGTVSIQLAQPHLARYTVKLDSCIDLVISIRVTENGIIEQCATATNTGDAPITLPYAHDMSLNLSRASYGQLTEGGPLKLPRSHNILTQINTTTMQVLNPELGAQLLASLAVENKPLNFGTATEQDVLDAPLQARIMTMLCVSPKSSVQLHAKFRLLPHINKYHDTASYPGCHCRLDPPRLATQWFHPNLITTYILKRNVDYILANCTVPLKGKAVAIVPDHVALPLGWNRDNYWQIHLLCETHINGDDLIDPVYAQDYKDRIKSVVQGHLNWVLGIAQRPHGYYHRSYLVNGRPKDLPIFQLDQQCYPLLELCDYFYYFPADTNFVRDMVIMEAVQSVLRLLLSKRDPETRLWPTEETPADDRVEYPYHFSSHVLLWRTFTRLADLFAKFHSPIETSSQRLLDLAAQLKTDVLEMFTSDFENGQQIFAYVTDGEHRHAFYYDANDVPTLFAHDWGFVSTPAEVKIWKATMDFGLSAANKDGYSKPGPYQGLGSTHSDGAWTLGYFQELAHAAWLSDQALMRNAWTRILAAMQWDGTFPEAVCPQTAKCTSKAWFSWPGAMIGALLIKLRNDGMEKVLLLDACD